jgi:uncharacterized protein YhbP (UPF0306 family)
MNVEQKIRDYLPDILHLSLATCIDNKPWVCEVHFAYDKELNLYFRSKKERRHSQEIAKNPRVAGNIITQHPKEQKPRGVYFEGAAQIVEDINQNQDAYKSFHDRLGFGSEILNSADDHKIYKVTVTDYYLFDSRESNPSQKYHLPWKSAGNT